MIYGEKFLNNNTNQNSLEFLIAEDINNFNNFLKNFNTEIDSFNEAKENVIDKIFEKISDLLRKVLDYIEKFINTMKYKIFKFGKKIIVNLDRLIAGKYSPTDEDLETAAFDRAMMTINPTHDSNVTEAASDSIEFYMICMNGMKQNIIVNYSEDLLNLSKEFLQLYDKDANYSEDHKDELENMKSEYEKMKHDALNYMINLSDDTNKLKNDIRDIKNYIKDNKFPSDAGKTRNEHMSYKKFMFAQDDKDSMKSLRNLIDFDVSTIDLFLKDATKRQNDTLNRIREINHIKDQYQHIVRGNGDGTISSIEYSVYQPIRDTHTIYVREYFLLNQYINAYLYCAKNDFKIAIRCINKWGNNKTSEK